MRESDYLRAQAQECRQAADRAQDRTRRNAMNQLASYYEKEAAKLDAGTLRVMPLNLSA